MPILDVYVCKECNMPNLFSCSKTNKNKKEVLVILDSIESMLDFKFSKDIIINVIFQKIKRLLGCEYYILHHINHRYTNCDRTVVNGFCNMEEFKQYLYFKNLTDKNIDIDQEEKLMQDFMAIQHKNQKNSISSNYVSASFAGSCSKDFAEKYFSTNSNICPVNLMSSDNVFGHVINTNEYFISDDIYSEKESSCRFPEGHPPIKSFMAIPFSNNKKVYAVAGFANSNRRLKDKDYDIIKPILNELNEVLPIILREN